MVVLATAALATAVLALGACNFAETIVREPPRSSQAQFSLDPEAGPPAPDATSVPLLVREVECASGLPADGRIRVEQITYGEDEVGVLLVVESPPGDQTCPSNPLTPFLLELDEPLAGRRITNIATDEIARRPAIEPEGPPAGDPGGPVLIEADESLGSLGEAEHFLVEALWARSQDPSELADLDDLSLADEVTLVLGISGIQRTVAREDLADPETWVLDDRGQGYEGFAGPFSPLDVMRDRRHLIVSIGDHAHCAGRPRPAPVALADFTRVGITPGGIDSCLQWFALDLFIDPTTGLVHGISMDLWGP